jgi:PilZ domain-containing protein
MKNTSSNVHPPNQCYILFRQKLATGVSSMTNKRFALRVDSRQLPVQITMIYLGQHSAGQGIVQELSQVGCRTLGNDRDRVVVGDTVRLQLSFPTSDKPLIIERAIVKWVKGLEFGIAFEQLPPRDADRLQRLLKSLLGKRNYSGRSALKANPPRRTDPHPTAG